MPPWICGSRLQPRTSRYCPDGCCRMDCRQVEDWLGWLRRKRGSRAMGLGRLPWTIRTHKHDRLRHLKNEKAVGWIDLTPEARPTTELVLWSIIQTNQGRPWARLACEVGSRDRAPSRRLRWGPSGRSRLRRLLAATSHRIQSRRPLAA